jgi:hypothetical protein
MIGACHDCPFLIIIAKYDEFDYCKEYHKNTVVNLPTVFLM